MDIEVLYRAARDGDREAEEQLFSLLTVRFRILADHRVWNEQDAQDVVQTALAVIVREYRSIDISVSFAAWAYKVLDNRILTYLKTRARQVEVVDDDPLDLSCADPDLKMRLHDCVDKVRQANVRYGQAVAFHCQGYTTSEICERLKVTPQNFYMILSRARAMLRRCLETGAIV